jgi:replicative DNA helicase
MAFFKFTAKLLQKTGYGYDISGETFDSTGKANQENQTNINDTAQPQDKHETPRNPANIAMDTEAEKENTEGKADLIIAKQRNGPVGDIKLTFLKEITRFVDRADVDDSH